MTNLTIHCVESVFPEQLLFEKVGCLEEVKADSGEPSSGDEGNIESESEWSGWGGQLHNQSTAKKKQRGPTARVCLQLANRCGMPSDVAAHDCWSLARTLRHREVTGRRRE
ncbi:hypothetical protein L5515_017451 [Caenorhabditis briggsae]|uniref:Uncharacterized protein n=1 Tax=Caenorhabditis briggsae TaxID=6238 RepID=A0AAE9FJG9_CAEBR|nr:hypothetical protein L5515_017451 [Caenorhabditis briggsae]